MDTIWANRLVSGTKTWNEMPVTRQSGVKGILRERVKKNEITPEKYEEITSEKYKSEL